MQLSSEEGKTIYEEEKTEIEAEKKRGLLMVQQLEFCQTMLD